MMLILQCVRMVINNYIINENATLRLMIINDDYATLKLRCSCLFLHLYMFYSPDWV